MQLNNGTLLLFLFVVISVISVSSENTHLIANDQSNKFQNDAITEGLNCDSLPQIALLTPENPQVNYTCFTYNYDNMLMIKDMVRPLNTSINAQVQFIVIVETAMDRDYVLYAEILGFNTSSVTTYSACEVTYLKSPVTVTHQAVLLEGSEATVLLQQTLGNQYYTFIHQLTALESVYLELNTSYQETSLNCTGCNQFYSFIIPSNQVAEQAYDITITITSSFAFPFSSISIAGGSYCPDMQSSAVRTETFGQYISGASISFYGASYGSWFVSCQTIAANVSYSIEVVGKKANNFSINSVAVESFVGNCDVVSKWCSDMLSSSSSSGYEIPALVLYIVGGVSLGAAIIIAVLVVVMYSRKPTNRKNNNSFDFRPQYNIKTSLIAEDDNSLD